MNTGEILNGLANGTKVWRQTAVNDLKLKLKKKPLLNDFSALTLAEKKELLALLKDAPKVDGIVDCSTLPASVAEKVKGILSKVKIKQA